MTALTPPRHLGSIPSLDGIRAIAVALVFFSHGGLGKFVPGGLGVTIFFVLSGYLITTLLCQEHGTRGAINYRAFYLRRLLRLMPPLFIIVALAGLLSATGVIDGGFTREGLLSALFYFGNYYVIAHDFEGLPHGLGVIWSLAVEEHYYLFYPPLAALLLRRFRRHRAALLLAGLCLLVLGWRCWLTAQGASAAYIGYATDTRVDSILVGCVMGLAFNPWLQAAGPRKLARDAALAALCVGALLLSLVWRDEFFRATLRYSLQSVAVAPLIYLAVIHAGRRPFAWLNSRPLVYLGTVSYTIYLCHQLILEGVDKHLPQDGLAGWLSCTAVAVVLTLLVAEPMRRWVELPCARLRSRLHRPRATPATITGALPNAAPTSGT